jgi:hypothetical protein
LEAALAIHRETGARFSEGIALINLGLLCHTQEQTEGGPGALRGSACHRA